ncbi:MAG: ABC transporter permease [Cyclobacteriaceae bacterium]|nr:ABC transporter permease [Cyclobacteriaceae bacterium]
MFKNYLTVAIRSMLKHRFFAAINLSGLVIGVTCCLFVFIYVKDELMYDRFHKDAEQIYRVGLHGKIAGQEIFTSNSSAPVGEAMQNEIPGITSTVRIFPITRGNGDGIAFRNDDKIFSETAVHYADSNFFQFFSFKLLEGDPKTALNEPSSVVITKALADKYFNGDAIGKILIIGSDNESFMKASDAEVQFSFVNAFPASLRYQAFFLDENKAVLDSALSNRSVLQNGALLDTSGFSVPGSSTQTVVRTNYSERRLEAIRRTRYLASVAAFRTPVVTGSATPSIVLRPFNRLEFEVTTRMNVLVRNNNP